ncbi:PQQ-binding-like beta-propeller repeat protein [Chryseobacterium sp. JAH]|uniref:outer membrane protein assembly factor BamB family protein n=1 Tax=Chryseobacterium sp. JAH TaxID=1742858 RepID=UPI0007413A68|nr:PQQ-binding-like beta-propeller repeat protein [Chryseobacterium sp. JAH]KUJ51054.1 hypothetical protein AR685_12575 [Chryseobacterium sp. JAH]
MNYLFPFKYALIFLAASLFAQTEMYSSEFPVGYQPGESVRGSIILAGNKIIYSAGNYTIYCINKENLKPVWEKEVGWRSDTKPHFFNDSFLYGYYDGQIRRVAQYDINTGEIIRRLDLESLHSKPYFINTIMYVTALSDGGKFVAYDLQENKPLWSRNIGHGIDFQPVYLNNKIIVKAEDDYWIEMDYKGNLLASKSKVHTYVDDEKVSAKKYEFLTHNGKEITKEFLKKHQLSNTDFKTEINKDYTFLLSEKYLTVIGKNGNKKLQVDLETVVPTEEYENDALSTILDTDNKQLWFVHQNHLIHFDIKKEKVVRNVYLNKWRPHQLIVDQKTIWLISKNDGQLYKLDFEPDEELDRKIKRDKAIHDRLRCDQPDPEKVKAAKKAKEKAEEIQKK